MRECIHGMRLLKLACWIDNFKQRLGEKRDEEVKLLRRRQICYGIMRILMVLYGNLLPVVTFTTFLAFSGYALDLKVVVTSLMYFDFIISPLIMLTTFKSALLSMVLSMKRISEFLAVAQIQEGISERGSS